MNFKSQENHFLSSDAYLSDIFKELPVNAFIDKGRCGNGANDLEIRNLKRCTIIAVPTIEIISSMLAEYEKDFDIQALHSKIDDASILNFLAKAGNGKKIISTPESIGRLMKLAERITVNGGTMYEVLANNWFLLLDESHSYITENYRENILIPFDYFFSFKQKSIISATPYYFSDPRMSELTYHKINIIGKVGTINIVNCSNVDGTLKVIIENAVSDSKRIFIFYNSLTSIVKLINACGLTDCHVYCADDEKGKNKRKLGANWVHFRPKAVNGEFALINFFTTKAFEGWNLKGEIKTSLFVATDIKQEHTLVGISKCIQAVGRWRKPDHDGYELPSLYHITNTRNIDSFKSIEELVDSYQKTTSMLLHHNIELLNLSIKSGVPHVPNPLLRRFCDDYESAMPKLNTYKFDQYVNEQFDNEVFNDLKYLKTGWETYCFGTNITIRTDKWESQRDIGRKSNADVLKDDYLQLQVITQDFPMYYIGTDETQIIKQRNPLAYQAFKLLTVEQMNEVKYNAKRVKQLLVQAQNAKQHIKLMKLILIEFKDYQSYTKEFIKLKLQELYDKLGLEKSTGTRLVAKATDIKQYFDVEDCKLKSADNKYVHGFKLIRKHFEMKLAA